MIFTIWLGLAAIGSSLIRCEGSGVVGQSRSEATPTTPGTPSASVVVARALEEEACMTEAQCDERRKAKGYTNYYVDDYSGTNAYGCFVKGGNAFWGEGGTDEQMVEGSLSGSKERVWCDGEGGDGEGSMSASAEGAAADPTTTTDSGATDGGTATAASLSLAIVAAAWTMF